MRQILATLSLLGLLAAGAARGEESAELLVRSPTWAQDVLDPVLGQEEQTTIKQKAQAQRSGTADGGDARAAPSQSRNLWLWNWWNRSGSDTQTLQTGTSAPTFERGDVTFDYDMTTGVLGVEDSVAAPDPRSTRISIDDLLQNDLGLACNGTCEFNKVNRLQLLGFGGNDNIASITQKGNFLYVEAATVGEKAVFNYDVFDRTSGSTSSVEVKIWFGNRKPQARNDQLVVLANSQSAFDVSALLANDSDPDGDPLDLVRVWYSQNGRVFTGEVDGQIKVFFQPDPDFVGEAYFNYTVADLSAAPAVLVAGPGAAAAPERMTFARGIVRVQVLASPS